MKKKAPKLKWEEMNKEQKVFFVLDWIMRGMLIALCLIIVGSMFVSCFKSCGKKEESTAYADTSLQRSSLYTSIDYQNDYSKVPYFNFNGVCSTDIELYIDITLNNFVLTTTTFEIVFNNLSSTYINLFFVYNDGSYHSLLFSCDNDVYHFTFNFLNSVSYQYAHLQLRYYNYPSDLTFDFNVYTYAGSYVPGYGQGLAAGLQQGKEEGYKEGYDVGKQEGNTEGYKKGYDQGILDSKYSIFNGVKVSARPMVTVNQQNYSVQDFSTEYTQDGVYFDNIASQYYRWFVSASNPGTQWLYTEINLQFAEAFDPKVYPIIASGGVTNTYSNDFNVEGVDGQLYTASWVRQSDGSYLMVVSEDVLVSKIQAIRVMSAQTGFTNNFRLSTILRNFNQGYVDGYNDGLGVGESTGYDKGYKTGFDLGHSAGFQEGFNQNKSGGFGWLINSVQEFLGTNFFGDFGIGTLLYVSLGVLLVMYFLKLLAGG